MADLAAIIDSWERLSTASMDDYSDQGRLNHLRLLARFRDQHFTTLLAVARAAVEMREAMALLVHTPYMENEFEFLDRGIGTETRSGKVLLAVRAALAAFDAQVDGDEAGVERALSEIRALVCARGGA